MTTADPFRIRFLSDPDVLRLGPGDLLDDERRCLGAAILDNVCLDGPLSGLTREHFSLPAHQELFTLMRKADRRPALRSGTAPPDLIAA